jgi:hypothetical protein
VAGSRVQDVVTAAVAALETIGARAYTHVPKGTDPPYELVMGGDELPFALGFACDELAGSPPALISDGGDSGGRTVDVIVSCVSTFRGSAEVDDMASTTLAALTLVETWAGVAGFQAVDFLRNTASVPADVAGDGVMWFLRTVVVRVTVT